jgi:hypothetical protein
MRSRITAQIAFMMLLVFPLVLSCGQKQSENQAAGQNQQKTATAGGANQQPAPSATQPATATPTPVSPAEFGGVEKNLLDTLLTLWQIKANMTSIDQAAKILGLAASDSVRADMLKKLQSNMSISEKLTRYHPQTFVLTNQEKLIAQYIVVNEKRNSEFPAFKKVAADLKIAEPELKARLKFLSSIGLLYDLGQADANNSLGYSFAGSLSSFTYDMGLRFHEFFVDDKLPFNVGCAKEALYAVIAEFPNNKVRYETLDPLTLAPVEVVFDKGQIVSVNPPEAKFVEGGSCGANNLFATQDNATLWIKAQPRLMQSQEVPIYGIAERFGQIVDQMKQQGGK